MASDDSDLAGAPLGAALCPEARGPLLFQRLLGPHRIVSRRPPLRIRRFPSRRLDGWHPPPTAGDTAWAMSEDRKKSAHWRDAGDRVVVELVQRGRLRSGLELATPVSNVWTFEGEAVVRLQMFVTWADALEATGLSE
jgi:hypothetical protein